MSSEYLRKTVADRRTGANLIGINVDTSNMTGMDNVYLDAVVQLEKFAKQSDELKIQNEKNKIALDNEKQMIEFRQKYFEDPSIYTDQAKWENVCKLWNEEIKNQKKRVADSIYLTKDEKILYSKKLDTSFAQAWTAPLTKRNEAELRARVNEATQLIELATFNASQSGLYRIDTIDNFMKKGEEILNPLVSQGGITEQDKFSVLMSSVAEIDASIFNRNFESQILYNSNLTTEEKKAKISEIKSMMSDKRVNEIADSFAKHYKINDGQKEYLKYKLKEQYQKSEIKLDKQLYNLEKDKKNTSENNARKIQEAYYKRDTSKYIEYNFGIKNVSTSQLLNDPDVLKLVTDISAEDFTERGLAFPFITEGINTALNGQIADRKKNPNYSLNEIYQPIYDFATEVSGAGAGFTEKRKNILIDYALKNGIEPSVLLKGESNSDYFKVSNIMSIGSQENKDNLNIRKLLGKKTEKFDELSQAFSPIKAVGDLMATNYVLGKAKARGQEDMLMQFPELGFQRLMTNIPTEEYTREIKMAKEITLNRTPYRYVNYNEQTEDKKELPKPKNTKQSDMFGG